MPLPSFCPAILGQSAPSRTSESGGEQIRTAFRRAVPPDPDPTQPRIVAAEPVLDPAKPCSFRLPRHGQRDRSQVLGCQLQIHLRCSRGAMAQNVANRLQRNVRPQQAHCPRVADSVWSALTFCLDTGQPDATAEHSVKTGPTGKGTEGCCCLDEDLSQRCLRSSLAEVVEEGLANCGHEWQKQVGICLRLLYP